MHGRIELLVCHLGRVEYREAAALQERLRERVIAGELPDLMLLLEHPPVYTVGRRSDDDDLPFGEAFYRERGIDVVRTPRGGQLTYHGPGQLVGYPIMHVASVPEYILTMERAIVAALADAGVEAARRSSATSTSACGSASARSPRSACTSPTASPAHGFAVNVDNDLDPFTWVVACGLPEVQMTSMAAEGVAEGLACFRKRMGHRFSEAFGRRQRLVTPARLGIDEPVAA